jgi:hypothetical protein
MGNSNDSGFWTDVDEYWQRQCKMLFVVKIDGWEESTGLDREIQLAKEVGQTIVYIDYPEDIDGI